MRGGDIRVSRYRCRFKLSKHPSHPIRPQRGSSGVRRLSHGPRATLVITTNYRGRLLNMGSVMKRLSYPHAGILLALQSMVQLNTVQRLDQYSQTIYLGRFGVRVGIRALMHGTRQQRCNIIIPRALYSVPELPFLLFSIWADS